MDSRFRLLENYFPYWDSLKNNISMHKVMNVICKNNRNGPIDLTYALTLYSTILMICITKDIGVSFRLLSNALKNTKEILLSAYMHLDKLPKWDRVFSMNVIEMKIKDLKKLVLKNNGVVIGNKKYKNTWNKAYINLQNISLSMVKKRLPDDIGTLMDEYLPNRDTQFTIFVGPAVWMSLKYTNTIEQITDFLQATLYRAQ
jgi:hypothetical protein